LSENIEKMGSAELPNLGAYNIGFYVWTLDNKSIILHRDVWGTQMCHLFIWKYWARCLNLNSNKPVQTKKLKFWRTLKTVKTLMFREILY
jgi:hypothetical protein